MGYVHRDLKPENIVLNLNPLEIRIIDFERSCLYSEISKATMKGTPGYIPESCVWLDGSKKWDIWALAAIICEADMPLDEYIGTKREREAKFKIRKHIDRTNTSTKLVELINETIF